jgi:hypothetical protein
MLIDSHHRFVPGWDETLVRMHADLLARGIPRPLITGYMPSYDPETFPLGRQLEPYKIYPLRHEQGLLIHLTSFPIADWQRLDAPVEADFVSGHFMFAHGAINEVMPCDPAVYFTGDEVSMSLRAFTHGYDLYHPHVVVGWHCYDRRSRTPHWEDHANWRDLHQRSLARVRRLFAGRLRGNFGLGNVRSKRSYEARLLLPLVADAAW